MFERLHWLADFQYYESTIPEISFYCLETLSFLDHREEPVAGDVRILSFCFEFSPKFELLVAVVVFTLQPHLKAFELAKKKAFDAGTSLLA